MKTIHHLSEVKLSLVTLTGLVKFDPATGEQSALVKLASIKDVNDTVSNSLKAYESWSNKPHFKELGLCLSSKNLLKRILMS